MDDGTWPKGGGKAQANAQSLSLLRRGWNYIMGTPHGVDGGGGVGHSSDPREERGRDESATGGPPGVCGLYNLGMFTLHTCDAAC